MDNDLIPDDVRNFIIRHIDSVAELEALLLLHSNPAEQWTVASTARRLYIGEQDASEVLTSLCEDGLVGHAEGSFRFGPADEQARMMIDRLAQVYSRHLIAVSNLIHAKPRRIRQFAEAFKFKKDR